jgi:hypothetical protein
MALFFYYSISEEYDKIVHDVFFAPFHYAKKNTRVNPSFLYFALDDGLGQAIDLIA